MQLVVGEIDLLRHVGERVVSVGLLLRREGDIAGLLLDLPSPLFGEAVEVVADRAGLLDRQCREIGGSGAEGLSL